MISFFAHDYIQSYEAGVAGLLKNPDDRDLQHQVVLALARAGALDLAISEYDRFGLANIRDHEDIMSLNGRLSKDLYLRHSGALAQNYAREAARKYEAAFQNTLGHYSGVNSATMALMADMPAELIYARVEAIEALLPISKDITPADHYFAEATRAECFLLKGDRSKAIAALHAAVDFDPLNYAAHSSTLKQFTMICKKRGENLEWLSDFRPPRPIHFAGHIRLSGSASEQDRLNITIADALQQQDVGFGYGALAAGSDILIAEALLEQGAELHVVLPCATDLFVAESVQPFGEDWVDRFNDCMARATTIRHLTDTTNWPEKYLNRVTGLSAMGHAILQGQSLSVSPAQMLILSDESEKSYTATHSEDWKPSGFPQYKISTGTYHAISSPSGPMPEGMSSVLKRSDSGAIEEYPNLVSAVEAAFALRQQNPSVKIALHIALEGTSSEQILKDILEGGAPQTCLASEAFASVLAVIGGKQYNITYAGQLGLKTPRPIRCFSIQQSDGLLDSVA